MIHNSAASGYQINSDTYAKIRPDYHPELMQCFRKNFTKGKIVDLGAGTGIFTRQLVHAGYSPIAIEPVPEMRAKIANQLPTVDVRGGTAEETGLVTASIDAVVVAQAFHWFNYQKALVEIKRILSSNGLLVCVWNVRDETVEWVRKYESTLNRYAGNTPRHRTMEWRQAIDSDSAFELVDE
ncbi:MAG: methyltransferase domain-containing protein [Candidatus Latescibacteria bacterium]|nr:methyltransferase domain-containing protein [Candidatus Latescibacterota bacterium]